MNITDSYAFYLLLVSNALLLAAAGIAVVRFRQQCQRLEQFWNSPTGTAIAHTQPDDNHSSDETRKQLLNNLRLEKRLADLQKKVCAVSSKPLQPVRIESAPVERPLPMDNALRMARHGASAEDLTRACGLNIGEARLMQKLHGQATAAVRA